MGPPAQLVFVSAPQTLQTGMCSNALTLETQDSSGQRVPVPTSTVVTLSAAGPGGPGVAFFTSSSCGGGSIPSVVMPSGQSSVTIRFRASQAGSPVISANAIALAAASQTQTIVNVPNQLEFVTPVPAPILAGQCLGVTLESRFNGTPAAVLNDTSISLLSSPAGALRFYSNPSCTDDITSVALPIGTSSVSFSVKVISGGDSTVTASGPFGTAQLDLNAVGAVRRGTCSLSSLTTQVICPINPAHQSTSRTMVVYQATSGSDEPVDSQVRCRLMATDKLSCERNGSGNQANISWQTAELVSGLNVQRSFSSACVPATVILPTPVDPSSSFVLSSITGTGSNFDGDDLTAARLSMDGSEVTIENRSSQACSGYELQVVELSGVTALRGSAPGMSLSQRTVTMGSLAAASPNSVVFNQALLAGSIANSTSVCNLMVRAHLSTPTSLTFSRGHSAFALNCAAVPITEQVWERVDFGSRARVQTFVVDARTNSFDVVIGQVDPTRTIVFAGGQMAGGQASGETDYNNMGDDSIGVGTARFDLSTPTNVRVTRGRSSGDARLTMYVVELEP